jgi:branched-subunit amino acid transport protein
VNEAWLVVLFVGAATMALKAAGPVAIGGRELPERSLGLVAALAPALLAALVVTQVFDGGRTLVIDERLAGLAVAAVLLALRVPILAVVIGAAATTALLRAI